MGRTHRQRNGVCECGAGDSTPDEEVAPSTTMQEQLRPMLRLILDNESKVKQLLQIRMDELAKLVGQSSVQKSVLSAYGDQGGFVLAPQDNFS